MARRDIDSKRDERSILLNGTEWNETQGYLVERNGTEHKAILRNGQVRCKVCVIKGRLFLIGERSEPPLSLNYQNFRYIYI